MRYVFAVALLSASLAHASPGTDAGDDMDQ